MNTSVDPNSDPPASMYVYGAGRISQVEALSDDKMALIVRYQDTHEQKPLPLSDLFAPGSGFVVASSLSELAEIIANASGHSNPLPQTSEERLLVVARYRISVVEAAEERLKQERREALRKGQKFRKVNVLVTKILPSLKPSVCLSEYYKFRRQYKESQGIDKALAAKLHRSTHGKAKLDDVTFHFIHTIILQFWGRGSQLQPKQIYKTAKDLLDKHTQGMWLDPTKCDGSLPDNILAQLLDEGSPIETLLTHPEHRVLLSPVKLPNISWFYKYLGYY